MDDELVLVMIDSDYCNYLRNFDKRFPYNYNDKELGPFVGVLVMVKAQKKNI